LKRWVCNFFPRGLALLVKAEEIIVFATIMFVTLAIFIQVILRYFTEFSLFGIEELVVIIIAWFLFISASYTVHHRVYIRVDLLSVLLKKQVVYQSIDLISLFVGIFSCGILAYLGFKYIIWSAQANLITTAFMISTNFQTIALPLGMGLIVLHMAIQLNKLVKEIHKSPKT